MDRFVVDGMAYSYPGKDPRARRRSYAGSRMTTGMSRSVTRWYDA